MFSNKTLNKKRPKINGVCFVLIAKATPEKVTYNLQNNCKIRTI